MASEPQNPFARNSAWPQMPQAPFRIGPLPKADAAPPAPATAAPQTVTPVYSRPLTSPPGPGPSGLITHPQPAAAPQPVTAPPPPPTPIPEPTPVAADPVPEPAAPETYFEMAPLIVRPPGSERRATPRKSPLPAIAAAGVGLAAVLGVAYALNKGQEAALSRPDAPTPATVAPTPVTPSVPTEPAEPVAETQLRSAPPVEAAKSRTPPPAIRPARPAPTAAPAAAEPPLLSLPPAAPAPAPQPSYTPPAAPDPSAPMTTQRSQ